MISVAFFADDPCLKPVMIRCRSLPLLALLCVAAVP